MVLYIFARQALIKQLPYILASIAVQFRHGSGLSRLLPLTVEVEKGAQSSIRADKGLRWRHRLRGRKDAVPISRQEFTPSDPPCSSSGRSSNRRGGAKAAAEC